tara:strand:- start:176 stop:322 length:147 start_codon:yes stop_codon:yes gene_type:complete
MKTKKLVKQALKKRKLFSKEELLFFKNWLYLKKKSKAAKINKRKEAKD